MSKSLSDILYLVFATLFLSLLALLVWSLHQQAVIDLGVLSEFPQWLVDAGFVALALFFLWVFNVFWKMLIRR